MFRKRLVITIVLVLIFAASFIAGYFTLSRAASEKNRLENSNTSNSNNNNVSAKTVNSPLKTNIVTPKTIVKIKNTYLIGSNNVYTKEIEDSSHIISIVGMGKDEVKKYFDKMNYKVDKFSPSEIVITAEVINSWPPNKFVVKSEADEIVIYSVDGQGILTLPQRTGIYLDMLPEDDRESVIKGKIYDNYQEVEELIDDYKS